MTYFPKFKNYWFNWSKTYKTLRRALQALKQFQTDPNPKWNYRVIHYYDN